MSWNIENLYRAARTGSGPRTKAVYSRKLTYLAGVTTGVNPDVLLLQEVGQPAALDDLVDKLGGAWTQQAVGKPDVRGIRVAILSRHSLSLIEDDLVDFPETGLTTAPGPEGEALVGMGRGVVSAVANIDGSPLRVLTAHLKSKLLTYPDGRRWPLDEDERARGAGFALFRRTAEAVALRVWINQRMLADPNIPVVLGGDLNDTPEAVTTVLLGGPDDGDPERPDQGDPVRHYNLASRLPSGRQFSRIYRGRGELIDHLLISRPLLLAGPTADALVDDITGITESFETRRDATVPDHAPVVGRIPWG